IAVIKRLAEAFRKKNLPMIYSKGGTREDNWDSCSWSWKNNRTAEGSAPKKAMPGYNEIVAEIAPQTQDIVISKQKPSAFFGTHLQSYLTYLGCDSIIATGCTTSGCV